MNKATITRLLNKKNALTGEEIGKLLLYNGAKEMEAYKSKGIMQSIFTPEEMQGIINTISDEYNNKMFNHYVNILNTIRYFYNVCLGYEYKALYNIGLQTQFIESIQTAIYVLTENQASPVIYTEKQYKELLQNKIKELTPEFKEKWNYADILNCYITHYTDIKNSPENDKIYNLLSKYKNSSLQGKYKADFDALYNYTSCSFKEYKIKTLETFEDVIKGLIAYNIKPKRFKILTKNGKALTKKQIKSLDVSYLNKKTIGELYDIFIKDDLLTEDILELEVTPETMEKYFTPEELSKYFNIKINTAPENSTIYDLLEALDDFASEYDTTETDILKDLCPEFLEAIKEKIITTKGLEDLKDIPESKYNDAIIEPDKIKDNPILTPNPEDIKADAINQLQQIYRGIAILKEDTLTETQKTSLIDAQGYYIKQGSNIDMPELNTIVKELCDIQGTGIINLIKENIRFIYAFNTFIDILKDTHKIEELNSYTISLNRIETHINSLNKQTEKIMQYSYWANIPEMREKILEIEPYINLEELKPHKYITEQAEAYIRDVSNFTGLSPNVEPINRLMV